MAQKDFHRPTYLPPPDGLRPYIVELSLNGGESHVGFCVGGSQPGPNILISGTTRLTGQVFQRLLLLPSLSRLRGKLFLVQLDKLAAQTDIDLIATRLIKDIIDDQMFLPFISAADMHPDIFETAVKDGYWTVLRLCAENGMISGRGVSPRPPLSTPGGDFIPFSSHHARRPI